MQNFKRRVVATLLAMAILLSQFVITPGAVIYASGDEVVPQDEVVRQVVSVANMAQLRAAINNAGTTPTEILFTENISFPASGADAEPLLIPRGGNISFTGNRTLSRPPETAGRIVVVHGTFVLDGVILDGGNHTVSGGTTFNFGGGGSVHVNGGTFIMESGEIRNSFAYFTSVTASNFGNGSGGAVFVEFDNSTFIMNGGRIHNNRAGNGGGGVAVLNGNFIMNGGSIENNRIEQSFNTSVSSSEIRSGGGVLITGTQARFTMNGGAISHNLVIHRQGANAALGGGVHLRNGGIFTMNYGLIVGNSARVGGGVELTGQGSTMYMHGGTITGNVSDGNGGGIGTSSGTRFTMYDGVIVGNMAGVSGIGNGGGLLANGVNIIRGGTIHDNTATGTGGGISRLGGEFRMYGGSITRNQAGTNGGGVSRSGNVYMYFYGGEIVNNRASGDGGGIHAPWEPATATHGPRIRISPEFRIAGNTAGNPARNITTAHNNWLINNHGANASIRRLFDNQQITYTAGTEITATRHTVTILVGNGRGSVSAVTGGATIPQNHSPFQVVSGTSVQFVATPDEGYRFSHWPDSAFANNPVNNPHTVAITGNRIVTAYFEEIPFVRVTEITGVPTEAITNAPLTLTGTVAPEDATNRTITWSITEEDAEETGAVIAGNTFTATSAGSARVTATVVNGLTRTSDFTQTFTITVEDPPRIIDQDEADELLDAAVNVVNSVISGRLDEDNLLPYYLTAEELENEINEALAEADLDPVVADMDLAVVDGTMSGTVTLSIPQEYLADSVTASREVAVEQDLADPPDRSITYSFSCPGLRNTIRIEAGLDLESPILPEDVLDILELRIPNRRITSLDGIEHLTSLRSLFAQNNFFEGPVDLTSNTELVNIVIQGSTVPTLDVSGLEMLEHINAANTGLYTLNVTGATGLTGLSISGNNLTGIIGTETLENLERFWAENNNFTSTIDLSNSPRLQMVDVRGSVANPNIIQLYEDTDLVPGEYALPNEHIPAGMRSRIASGFRF